MKKWIFSVFLLFLLWAMPAVGVNCLVSTLDTCAGSPSAGTAAWVVDGKGPGDCTIGGGSSQHRCVRRVDGTWGALESVPSNSVVGFTSLDESTYDGYCATRDASVTPQLCTAASIYYIPIVYRPYFITANCHASNVTQAAAAQVLSLNMYYSIGGGAGTVGATFGTIDMETASSGQAWQFVIRERAPGTPTAATIQGTFSATGTGALNLSCNLLWYE